MNDDLKQLAPRLCVTDYDAIHSALNGTSDFEFIEARYAAVRSEQLSFSQIGAVISIDPRLRQHNIKEYRFTHLVMPENLGIEQYLTPLFYSDSEFETARTDLFVKEDNAEFVQFRRSALETTLKEARRLLSNIRISGDENKKLIVHCVHGKHRSPVLMLAIMLNELPKNTKIADIMRVLVHKISLQTPKFREGELAFMDVHFHLGGALIEAWRTLGIPQGFNFSVAHGCRLRFEKMWPDSIPIRSTASLHLPKAEDSARLDR